MSTKVSKKIDEQSDAQLPEPRKGKVVRHDIQLPLQNTSLATVIYWIAGALLLYLSYYVYLVNRWCASFLCRGLVVIDVVEK